VAGIEEECNEADHGNQAPDVKEYSHMILDLMLLAICISGFGTLWNLAI
jgi:hypothetical protein